MKKIKHLTLSILLLTMMYSCSDSNPIEDEIVTTRSVALRTLLNQIKVDNNISGRSVNNNTYYDFVYPVSLSYNNGTELSVNSFSGLTGLLTEENQGLFIEGISFPFEVVLTADNSMITISNEADFNSLNSNYDFTTINEIISSNCFDLVYPISITTGSGVQTVNNENELLSFLNGNTNQIDFVFPISIEINGQVTSVENLYQLFDILNECVSQTCDCPSDIDPVCVQTGNGIVQYDNACLAECDGFVSADFVNCGGNSFVFGDLLGTCFDLTYPVDVTVNNSVFSVGFDAELFNTLGVPNPSDVVAIPQFSYPIEVTFYSQNSTTVVTINNEEEFEIAIGDYCN